jgi:uncharacterized protein
VDSHQIQYLSARGATDENCAFRIIETHISWVLLCDRFAYKIKKPIKYSFLDFSTLQKRKYYCEREVELNRRLTSGIYLGVARISLYKGRYLIDNAVGTTADYCVKMIKMPLERQMDNMIDRNLVSPYHMQKLASKLAAFYKSTCVLSEKDVFEVAEKFSDILVVQKYIASYLGENDSRIISNCVRSSDEFIRNSADHLRRRLWNGYYRDGHGDLYCKNIFLMDDPQPYDCIEFNNDYRQVDVLNDIAFLCMDLEYHAQVDLSRIFIESFDRIFPVINVAFDKNLFDYYKAYRANIRAKISVLRAQAASNNKERRNRLDDAHNYLKLMSQYTARYQCHAEA